MTSTRVNDTTRSRLKMCEFKGMQLSSRNTVAETSVFVHRAAHHGGHGNSMGDVRP